MRWLYHELDNSSTLPYPLPPHPNVPRLQHVNNNLCTTLTTNYIIEKKPFKVIKPTPTLVLHVLYFNKRKNISKRKEKKRNKEKKRKEKQKTKECWGLKGRKDERKEDIKRKETKPAVPRPAVPSLNLPTTPRPIFMNITSGICSLSQKNSLVN